MPPGVGSSVATVAVADAVEDHPRLRFEDCRTDLFPEPVSGDADGRFDRLEEVKVGVPRGQLVSISFLCSASSWPFYCGALSSPRGLPCAINAATQRAAGSRMAAALSPAVVDNAAGSGGDPLNK